ncbi:MAG: hypothetical protein K1060chlam5_00986 [Candidatus Anoxychlamydiales bacterium]|nr:hypothetical protein [Candidatus Anoxychlamydiales bacterium]
MIEKIKKIMEIEPHIEEDALIAFDLDNTLVTSSSYYGSVNWEEDLIENFLKEGHILDEAITKACDMWYKAQNKVQLKLIENNTIEFINKWKNTCNIIGLTARSAGIKDITIQNLKLNNIIFNDFKEHYLELFHGGVLFCSGKSKSILLTNFLEKILKNEKPKKILVIDDKKNNLEDILNSALIKNFEIKCFHYLNMPTFKTNE